jgi:hypothetical protein
MGSNCTKSETRFAIREVDLCGGSQAERMLLFVSTGEKKYYNENPRSPQEWLVLPSNCYLVSTFLLRFPHLHFSTL